MPRKIAPREAKTQEVLALLQAQSKAHSGEEFRSALVRLSTERVLQEALEREQAEVLGHGNVCG